MRSTRPNTHHLTDTVFREAQKSSGTGHTWKEFKAMSDVDLLRVLYMAAVFSPLVLLAPFVINQKSYKYASLVRLVQVSLSIAILPICQI